jgi:hypothetical protein
MTRAPANIFLRIPIFTPVCISLDRVESGRLDRKQRRGKAKLKRLGAGNVEVSPNLGLGSSSIFNLADDVFRWVGTGCGVLRDLGQWYQGRQELELDALDLGISNHQDLGDERKKSLKLSIRQSACTPTRRSIIRRRRVLVGECCSIKWSNGVSKVVFLVVETRHT